ncbi:hypothetical protein DFP72DRAFT_859239 [Ephemerocybe angulata]|uniref:Uncharacterized protein n=1 Tax=Ephemerocybe angulata TaxID=980116 RepID=A0A8H6HBM1_9AGAR|nr:hypothetical protein DFP72DRAFT_859239 [Tulosesus angulatus]
MPRTRSNLRYQPLDSLFTDSEDEGLARDSEDEGPVPCATTDGNNSPNVTSPPADNREAKHKSWAPGPYVRFNTDWRPDNREEPEATTYVLHITHFLALLNGHLYIRDAPAASQRPTSPFPQFFVTQADVYQRRHHEILTSRTTCLDGAPAASQRPTSPFPRPDEFFVTQADVYMADYERRHHEILTSRTTCLDGNFQRRKRVTLDDFGFGLAKKRVHLVDERIVGEERITLRPHSKMYAPRRPDEGL